MSLANDYIDSTEQSKQAVNYLLEDGYTIDVFRSQTTEVTNAGFDTELSQHTKIETISARIDTKGSKFIGLTDFMDCQKNDIWRYANARDEIMYYRVTDVLPRIGGCQVMMEKYTKWQS